ncbi:MAG: DNA polymerase III subunit gamma/tau [Thiohalocapsa sp.]|jgi:DNA polymerase-3 subunit gamma/tau|uniref:DNA polymerase III subunit gamma/tau n=1 Tax=Thiohalocapsa sp. TaxID=2497641 RepID=UPI0025ECF0EC|nr:DNA polymerase III subunit gamma/tau [Thiohalocapsa sp.]MCG6943495.1 DNA polymerase III subunit gamma/tau [Thiohalocapsa sp.]
MTYQVLARKWRPRVFADLVGQGHVVQALSNGLERGQLHHAYLFTGTRGVGKTTLARILAKTLNCEQGVGPTPCGTCSACTEIDSGRFVDLIEVDAASRTKVEQTRDLLDNVPFAPVRGRYKVYLIDEVHMFSASSFNALLKTLEEPPEHVKFVLATTDPQKLPATVLSRCLQFHLKRLLPEQIQGRFRQVLEAEGIGFDDQSLALLARAADGSMRDGLSLLDQAIAFGGGQLAADDVRRMLGTHTGDLVPALVSALGDSDGKRLLAEVDRLAELTPDFAAVLTELITLLHRVALAQQVSSTVANEDPDAEVLRQLAADVPAEDIQLFYQILLTGQGDLPLAPDPRTGFEMVLLRALAFRPAGVPAGPGGAAGGDSARSGGSGVAAGTPLPQRQSPGGVAAGTPLPQGQSPSSDVAAETPPPPERASDGGTAGAPEARLASADDWHRLVAALPLSGLASQLAAHCALVSWDGKTLRLGLAESLANLRVAGAEQRLGAALAKALGREVTLSIDTGPAAAASGDDGADAAGFAETPAGRDARNAAERVAAAEATMDADQVASELKHRFDADWVPGSIRPTD